MPIDKELLGFARTAINQRDPSLENNFLTIARLLDSHPEFRGLLSTRFGFESEEYWENLAQKFVSGRTTNGPTPPSTFPDRVVSIILSEYFDVPFDRLDQVAHEHKLSMAAENYVGFLLELYLSQILEPLGWIWCTGSVVRSIDFIKFDGEAWFLLQIKNRDNSENSSSSAIREGTEIQKWFRTFSARDMTNWENFPDSAAKKQMSEDNFRAFVKEYLKSLK